MTGVRRVMEYVCGFSFEIVNHPNIHSSLCCTDGHPAKDFISQSPWQLGIAM